MAKGNGDNGDSYGHRDSIRIETRCNDIDEHNARRTSRLTQVLAVLTLLGILGTQLAMWTQKADKEKVELLANDVSFIKGMLTGDRPIPDKSPLHSTIHKP